ncbi:MAG: ATP-binding cassette domain-containing protein [Cloacibacillus porcorum]|uniref:ABC transporter ATP-binding protein n=1 Tax=Cloacibacillus porcorum TaxID=1197717 RepID=UPI0023F32741|nr:ATP-binding cassette domain-containing protein [Cloacibacillus porcorum]MCD7878186.1 ATP-binding cassette domain-containing protein [Cloacibacillus porcorum]
MPFINIRNIHFSYGEEKILDNIDMDIERGDFVCLLGQSGCGKSTFLRLLAGLAAPSSGSIVINGKVVTGASLDRGVVFQDYSLFPWFTSGKNIVLSMQQKFRDMTKQDLKERAMFFLKRVGLDESVYNKYPNELSGGMRQRCAICRSFALDPPILLMDEPFGALDAVTRAHLQNLILSLWNQDSGTRKLFFLLLTTLKKLFIFPQRSMSLD